MTLKHLILITIILFLLQSVKSQASCLIYDPIYTSRCLACNYGYYFEEFSTSSPILKNFSLSDCHVNSNDFLAEKEIYVADAGCQNGQIRDGSHDLPFCNFSQALMAGQGYTQGKSSSKLTYFFIHQDITTLPKQYFWDSEGLNTVYHFFRRVNVSITIKPLYCKEKNISGCFENVWERPILFLRTERHFIFVTNIFALENIIVDGSEMGFGNYNESLKVSYFLTRFCNDFMIENSFDQFNMDPEKAEVCYLKNRSSTPSLNKFGLINIEPIFDCANCMKQPSSIFVRNCEFRHMHSFSEKTSSVAAIFSAQRLRFSLKIESSNFLKLNLPEGVFTSFGGSIPEIYKTSNEIYLTAVGNQILNTNENLLMFNKSTLTAYNYFNVSYPRQLAGIFTIESLSHQLIIMDSYFSPNSLPSGSIRAMFFVNIPQIEPDIYFSLLFTSNLISQNKINSIFEFSRVNSNPKGAKYLSIFKLSKFLDNYGCGFNSSMMDFNITDSVFSNIWMQNPLIKLNMGRIYIYSTVVSGFRFILTFPDSIIKFEGISLASEYTIFKTAYGPSLNITLESAYISNSTFIDLLSGIVATKYTLNYLKIYNGSFKNIIPASQNALFLGNVEDDFYCLDSNFENIIIAKIFGFLYSRSHTLINSKFKNITGTSILDIRIYGEGLPVPVHTLKKIILTQSSFDGSAYSTYPVYTRSRANFIFEECIFDKIRVKIYLIRLMIDEVVNVSNCSFNLIESTTNSGSFLMISGYGSTTDLGEFTIRNCKFTQSSGILAAKFLDLVYFRKGIVRECVFLGEDKNIAPTLIRAFITPDYLEGFLKITKCLFTGLQGTSGGALSIELWSILNIDIDDCDFIGSKGNILATDLIFDFSKSASLFVDMTKSKMFITNKFGVRNNRFVFSKGQEGGSITMLENVQLYLYNNSFIEISAGFGGCIVVRENCQLIFMKNIIANISCSSDGAAVWAMNSLIFIYSSIFQNTYANNGGAIYLNNVTAEIYYSQFKNSTSNTAGGILNAVECTLKIKNFVTQQGKALLRGGSIFITKGALSLRNSTFSDRRSEGVGGALYLQESNTIYIYMLSIFSVSTQSDGIIYILGEGSKKYYLENITFYRTSSGGRGDCFYFDSTTVLLKNLYLNQIYSLDSIIWVDGALKKSRVEFSNTFIINTYIKSSILKSYFSEVTLNSVSVININVYLNQDYLLIFENSKCLIKEFYLSQISN